MMTKFGFVEFAPWFVSFVPSAIKKDLSGSQAARFFRKVLKGQHTQPPRVITVDKNAAYRVAIETLKQEETIGKETELRQSKYLNNMIEQDHRNIKPIVKPMMGFKTFNTARRSLSGIEAMNMIQKGQVKGVKQGDSVSQAKFIEAIFGMAA
ncbi:DDE-type integrase/transposase/recombinase [Leptolyngbya sp. FACHB-541]|uniref:DDE-type integrase/transposase/recombinase n=1 Tax=Leptolyngbya sp. FACHB-541 TaxID=2692810 RepID=UPI001689BAD5|nr:DDE-type integrase/transposase/recombinase [Leptolyngbya sp. FACHB-541]MBD1995936.1 DDE-type integrase/transposase/recombinase [Leptolyngbya sp. FACHB-541]